MRVALNNRINSDWQFRCATLPAGYAERSPEDDYGYSGTTRNTALPGILRRTNHMWYKLGGDPAKSDPNAKGGWARFFADDSTNRDRYQPRLKRWFVCWGHPLYSDNTPSTLDWAISQTNMFLDQSISCNVRDRSVNEWKKAMETFAETISELDASGVIIVSKTIADCASWHAEKGISPKWSHTIGDNLSWGQCRYGRLNLRIANGAKLPIVTVSHPRYCPADSCVENSREVMAPWLNDVIVQYRKKQNRRNNGSILRFTRDGQNETQP